VPRAEFIELSDKLNATNDSVTRVRDSVKTIQEATAISALNDSKTRVGGEDLVSIRTSVGKVREIAEENAAAITKLKVVPVGTSSSQLEVKISDVTGRLDRLSVNDVTDLPDFSSFLTIEDYGPALVTLTELGTTSKLHTYQLAALTLKQTTYASSSALSELRDEFDEHKRTAATLSQVDEATGRIAKHAVEALRTPTPELDGESLARVIEPIVEAKLKVHVDSATAEITKQNGLIMTRAS